MDKNFCRLIDQQLLVEQYVAGKLKGELLDQFEDHLKKCEVHVQAVTLEKAFKRGASDYARNEIKTSLRQRIDKRRETRFIMLRYAAVLLVAVITPLLLYYQYQMSSNDLITAIPEKPVSESPSVAPAADSALIITEIIDETEPQSGEETAAAEAPAKISSRGEVSQQSESISKAKGLYQKQVAAPVSEAGQAKRSVISARSKMTDTETQTLQKQVLAKYLKSEKDSLRQCVDDVLPAQQRDAYRIGFSIIVSGNGTIDQIEITNRQVDSPALENCLIGQIKSWEFLRNYPPVTLEATWTYISSQ